MNMFKKSSLLLGVAVAVTMTAPAYAQVTTSEIRGTVTTETGAPISGASVLVVNNSSGFTRTVNTDANGQFSIRNLSVSGGYDVSVSGNGYQSERVEGIGLNLGGVTALNFDLAGAARDEIIVVAQRSVLADVAVGPSANFSLSDLENSPAINRNIADVIRQDPRIYVDESRGDVNAITCGGLNSRFNSLTVDGVRLNDSFGLNANGYPTERMPFSFDAIEQVAVEMAPFDVQYGGFTACNINAVTKSGGNEFHGGAFFDYTSDGLRGNSLEGQPIQSGEYSEKRYGINVGGPIIKDRVFFFAAYEKLEGANLFDRGAIGSGAVNEVNVTQAELDEILDIARTVYQYDPGEIPTSAPNGDEKLLIKLDANLSDQHRATFTYNYNDGFNISGADRDLNEIEFFNHHYERGAKLNSYVGALYSDWTDNFSTELRAGYTKLDNRQISVGGTDFGEIRVELDDVDVYLGGDDSRQSNKLNYDLFNFAVGGRYTKGDHNFSFGFEHESLDIFNLFVQHSETEIRFENEFGRTAIDNFRQGFASAIYYNNAPSNNPDDAAAVWGYSSNTIYAQDEWDFNDELTLIGGLRYDWYTTGDTPAENPDFLADYGFSNAQTIDGEGLIQPRFGFQWQAADNISVRGGVGLYSGGNPNVWLSNSYSANNVLQFGQRGRSFGLTDGTTSLFDPAVTYAAVEDGVPNGPGYGVPQDLFDAVAGGVGDNFDISYVAPDFKIPSEWKYALGATFDINDYVINADALVSISQNPAIILRSDIDVVGQRPDGSNIYASPRENALALTNSDVSSSSVVLSLGVAREYDNGLDWAFGYAYTDSTDVNPMTSAVAFTNYVERAFSDPQEQVASTSSFNIPHRFTLTTNYEKAFFGDNMTRLSVYAQMNEGTPYSLTQFGNGVFNNFTPFLDGQNSVLIPGAERNGESGSWWGKVDMKIEQEVPGIMSGHKASVFMVIDNLTNLLNDDWGILRQTPFPGLTNAEDPANPGQFLRNASSELRVGDASRYEIRFGAKYDF